MALHTGRRAANVVGRCGVVYREASEVECWELITQIFSGAFEEAMRWCAWGVMDVRYCLLVHSRMRSVQRILRHIASANKCTMRHICVLNIALYLAAAALCIEWLVGGGYSRVI